MSAHLPAAAPTSVRPADRLRLVHYLRLVESGAEPTAACWQTLTHPDLGMRKFIERADAPLSRKVLLARVDRLFKLGCPDLVSSAADAARATLAQHADANVRTMLDIAAGRFPATKDASAKARAQRESAQWCLEAGLGVAPPKGGGGAVQVNVAQQVNTVDAHITTQQGAERILREHAAEVDWARAAGRAEALGLPAPPRPRAEYRRIEDDWLDSEAARKAREHEAEVERVAARFRPPAVDVPSPEGGGAAPSDAQSDEGHEVDVQVEDVDDAGDGGEAQS